MRFSFSSNRAELGCWAVLQRHLYRSTVEKRSHKNISFLSGLFGLGHPMGPRAAEAPHRCPQKLTLAFRVRLPSLGFRVLGSGLKFWGSGLVFGFEVALMKHASKYPTDIRAQNPLDLSSTAFMSSTRPHLNTQLGPVLVHL